MDAFGRSGRLQVVFICWTSFLLVGAGASLSGSWSYNGTAAAVTNPDRGFRIDIDDISTVTADSLDEELKSAATGPDYTVALCFCYLTEFIGKSIPQSKLEAIANGLHALQNRSMSAILRFAYSKSLKPESGPTFDDVMRHAESLAPLVKLNSDVIMAIQAGFIGYRGEWHDSFHQLESNHSQLAALVAMELFAWTVGNTSRQVQVAQPLFKENWILRATPPQQHQKRWQRDVVTNATQRSPAAFARIGYHEDQFLLPSPVEGQWSSQLAEPGAPLFDYKTAESPFVAVDGSLDRDQMYSVDGFRASRRLRLRHYDTFSATVGYDPSGKKPGSINAWMKADLNVSQLKQYMMPAQPEYLQQQHTVFEYVHDHLGYRIQAVSASYSITPFIEHNITFKAFVSNFGFSAPVNIRYAYLVFLETNGDGTANDVAFVTYIKSCDPRVWHPFIANDPEFVITQHQLDHYAALPGILSGKTWLMGLHLTAFPGSPLTASASTAVRFANTDMQWWTTKEGLGGVNVLGSVTVSN